MKTPGYSSTFVLIVMLLTVISASFYFLTKDQGGLKAVPDLIRGGISAITG